MLKPFPGIPIAFLVIALMLGVVVGGGKALRGGILLPIINNLYAPFVKSLVSKFVSEGILYNILVGEFGVLIKGIEWPFALVLSLRIFVLCCPFFLRGQRLLAKVREYSWMVFLKRIGLNGGNIIPIIMGYGCAVPAILGSRAATTKKRKNHNSFYCFPFSPMCCTDRCIYISFR